MSSGGPFLYPQVSTIPSQTAGIQTDRNLKDAVPGEFDRVFESAISTAPEAQAELGQARTGLKFSSHALQRLQQRNIALDSNTMAKVNSAIDKAAAKGVEDTLVLTKDAALIVSVKNRTIITALDRGSLDGNVFTNIDGAVIV